MYVKFALQLSVDKLIMCTFIFNSLLRKKNINSPVCNPTWPAKSDNVCISRLQHLCTLDNSSIIKIQHNTLEHDANTVNRVSDQL